MVSYLGYRLGKVLAGCLPAHTSYDLARLLALLHYGLADRHKRALIENLRTVFGERLTRQETCELARAIFCHFSYCVTDFLRLPSLDPAQLQSRFSVDGLEVLERLQSAGKGGIIMSAHLGCWELGGAFLASRGLRMWSVARAHEDARVNNFFMDIRRAMGIHILPSGSASGPMLGSLRTGGLVALLADRRVEERGITTAFFGRPAVLPRGHVTLALRTGSPVVPAFAVQESRGKYRLYIEEPIQPPESGGLQERAEKLERSCISVLERYVRAYPEQWYAFHPIW